MDVDERMATIADAIRDSGASMQQAARYAQDLGFEQQAAAAFFMSGGDAIRSYRDDVEALGLSISDIDAAQVEAANDAMGIFGDAIDGVSQQLAVEMAPILNAVSAMFEDAAKEAGGFASVTSDAFEHVVNAAAFVIDAVEGIRRVFSVAADGIIAFWSNVAAHIARRLERIVSMANSIPGVDLSGPLESIRSFARQAENVTSFAMENIGETLNEPMPGGQFKQFVADAREASATAAEEAVRMQEAMRAAAGGGDGSGEESEADKKRREELQKNLEAVRQANLSELEALREKQAQELEIINQGLESKHLTEQSWYEMSRETKARHEEELTAIEERAADARTKIAEAEAEAKRQALGNALTDLSSLMNSESRKMFEVGKAAAIANTVISTISSAQKAYESLAGIPVVGPALGAAAAAAAVAAGTQRVSAIRSQSFGGGGSAAQATGSNTAAVNAQSEGVRGTAETSRNVYVRGINPNEMFSGRQMIDIINEAQEEGAQLRIAS